MQSSQKKSSKTFDAINSMKEPSVKMEITEGNEETKSRSFGSSELAIENQSSNSFSTSNIPLKTKKIQRKSRNRYSASSNEHETIQAKCSTHQSTSSSKNCSPPLSPLLMHKKQNVDEQNSHLTNKTKQKNLSVEWKIKAKAWILNLISAVEEDLSKTTNKCSNNYCIKVGVPHAEQNKRPIIGKEMWLCEDCIRAFDNEQFCEFCGQIYLADESANLDGKEWAQCEGTEKCSRWGHVDCIAEKYGKSREIVTAPDFKYECGNCLMKLSGKRSFR